MVILINLILKSFLFHYVSNQKSINVSLNTTNVDHKELSEVEVDFIAQLRFYNNVVNMWINLLFYNVEIIDVISWKYCDRIFYNNVFKLKDSVGFGIKMFSVTLKRKSLTKESSAPGKEAFL